MFLMSQKLWNKCFGSLKEDEIITSQNFDFKRFKNEYENFIKRQYKKLVNVSQKRFLNKIPYLKECYDKQQIKYMGKGSSRIVFAFSDGKALKCALNKAGIEQNKTEINNIANTDDFYSCFPSIYEYNDEYYFLITDCCRKIISNDIKNFYNITFDQFITFLRTILDSIPINKNNKITNFKKLIYIAIESYGELIYNRITKYQKEIQDIKNNIFYTDAEKRKYIKINEKYIKNLNNTNKIFITFANLILSKKSEAINSTNDLLQFYLDVGKENLIFDDLTRKANWGILRKNDSDAPVVIDAGFSEKVWNNIYKRY